MSPTSFRLGEATQMAERMVTQVNDLIEVPRVMKEIRGRNKGH